MILVIDNYDSFVWNLARYLEELGYERVVVRNDHITPDEVEDLAPSHLLLSPGPGGPADAGVSMALVERFSGRLPILGVCLGHLCIGAVFGARVARAARPMHGASSLVSHDGRGVFHGVPNPLRAARYHSLVLDEGTLGADLAASAHSPERELMAMRHRTHPTVGLQFHPESVLTESGYDLLHAFLRMRVAPGATLRTP